MTRSFRTLLDLRETVLAITDPDEAVDLFGRYTTSLVERFGLPVEAAVAVARTNIGWCYGEGMPREQIAMWRAATGAEHPAGKIEDLTPEEIFEAGRRWAEDRPRESR